MTRNVNGVYTLPPGINPVVSGTLIDTNWANPTLTDVANAITESLDRNGRGAMLAPLILSADPITRSKQATSKEYVDQFLAYATGMPLGAIAPMAGSATPSGWLLCNGQAVNRTTYADLFTAIGTIYGSGDGINTFNVPDLRNEFIRGLGGVRTVGSKQVGSLASHSHPINQGSHTHDVNFNSANASVDHSHVIDFYSQWAGAATGEVSGGNGASDFGTFNTGSGAGVLSTSRAAPNRPQGSTGGGSSATMNLNITDHQHRVLGSTSGQSATHQHTISGYTVAKGTGVTSTDNAGGTETVPQNTALNYYIKALNDVVGPVADMGPAFRVTSSVVQSIPTGVATEVTFNQESFDTNSAFASNRFTPQVPGYYQVQATVNLTSSATLQYVELWKNGTQYTRGNQRAGSNLSGFVVSDLVYLNGTTDYLSVAFYQNSGAAVSTNAGLSYFSGSMTRKA